MRSSAPAWDAGSRREGSLEVDLKGIPRRRSSSVREADVVLESSARVASRLGIGPEHVPERTVYCSITGFGLGGRHEQREARPRLPRLGGRALGHPLRCRGPIADFVVGELVR